MKNDVLNVSLEEQVVQENETIPMIHVKRKPVYSFFKRVFDI